MKNYKLIQARKTKGYTQEKLAKKLEYRKSTISNWENGYSTPKMEDAFKLAEILEKDIKDLFLNQKEQDSHTNTA
ncbi:helix-turn-helix transcriptional regulator [Bacillus haynesii]|uniref:helix-turn-helix transcriptional regulator n=1 Tax=Bacillus haynesii TaxID=1925021 RepID=UPI002282A1AB|nr:helix-turn-helix transcriptional regulator [Bacillus haynesii]MCY8144344.1 helix-turn-helix domain-containing protein [Bacillus haynesii]MEC1455366.1 helix-turn-helix transcriptional regulator [Bacillus haynesii]MEC1571352.1 helix-turn-helix transcriptional regulator [Bacillus haynesii]